MQSSNSTSRRDKQILRIKRLLAPPVFQNDDVKTRRARLLNIALINVFILIPVLVIGNWLGGKTPISVIGVNFVVLALCLVLYVWMRRGRIRLASIGLMTLGLVGITAAIASLGTVRAPSVAMYLLMIITAGLLFDLAGIVVTTVLCSFLVAGLIVAGNMGLLPPPNYSVTITQWFAYTAIFGWTASLTFSSLRSMYIALAQADNELAKRKFAEAELTKHSEHLEEFVKVRTSELQEKNVMLTEEIADRKRIEKALRESEEKYHLLIDTANESVFVLQDGLLKFVNHMTFGLLGGDSEQELIDRPFPQFIHPDDRSMVVENYRRRIATRAASPRYAFRVVTHDGIIKWVEIDADVIEWQGKPATLNFLTEITERKKAEEELRKARDELERRVRERTTELETKNTEMERFIYTVSHDLRTPLISVSGLLGFLKQDAENGDMERMNADFRMANEAVTKMDQLLLETLELSRIGRVVNPPKDVPFGEIVADALKQTSEKIRSKGFKVSVAQNLPEVHVDRMRITEVLVNLIENSIKYGGLQSDPEIEIGQRIDGKDRVFFVRDNGIGIDPSQHDKVFELFYKVDKKKRRNRSRSGHSQEDHRGSRWKHMDRVGDGTGMHGMLHVAPCQRWIKRAVKSQSPAREHH